MSDNFYIWIHLLTECTAAKWLPWFRKHSPLDEGSGSKLLAAHGIEVSCDPEKISVAECWPGLWPSLQDDKTLGLSRPCLAFRRRLCNSTKSRRVEASTRRQL